MLLDELVDRIRSTGPLRFDDFVEAALYHREFGFFTRGSGAGRVGGDFLTSPEVGPLFGALFARHLDRLWIDAGRPDRFVVAEVAAGRGALAIAVKAASPLCGAALEYHLVERSAELRQRQSDHLSISADTTLEGPRDKGPTFLSHAEMDDLEAPVDVIFANELLDNIPIRVIERTAAGWSEVHIDVSSSDSSRTSTVDGGTVDAGVHLVERLEPLGPDDSGIREWAKQVVPDARLGARIPVQQAAIRWLAKALDLVRSPDGVVVIIDYCRSTTELAQLDPSQWLRTYRDHGRGGSPLDEPGSQDITCDVALDQLARLSPWKFNVSQAEWLTALGVADLVEEGRRIWDESASAPDLAAIRARSRVSEAEALCDEAGLGGFRVLGWQR
ncbi:MAG: SAM-dependent methyltransferase [Microthrixaceae bacterium]